MDKEGTIHALRKGFEVIGAGHFDLCYFEPTNPVAEESRRLYQENLLHVQRQVKFSEADEKSLDMVNASKFEWMSLMTAMEFSMDTNTTLGEYRQPGETKQKVVLQRQSAKIEAAAPVSTEGEMRPTLSCIGNLLLRTT